MDGIEAVAPDLVPSHIFRNEIEREMLRSDRTGSPLTLLVFDVSTDGRGRRSLEKRRRALGILAAAVTSSSRRTDSRGWYRDPAGVRVGLILHHTSSDGAQAVIAKVRQTFAEQAPAEMLKSELTCEVYGYPGDYRSGNGREPEQLWLFDNEVLASLGDSRNGNDHKNGHPSNKPEGVAARQIPEEKLEAAPVKKLFASPLPTWKRALDIFGSSVGLVLLSPLFLFVAIAIKLSSPGPVFFKQKRVGYLGDLFVCWKFRSMRDKADTSQHQAYLKTLITSGGKGERPMIKLDPVNPQITWIGNIIRKTCIDELPQLINVLLGEMSLVGPRPCLPYEAEQYLRWHTRRFDSVPGMTGLWQVMGKNKTTFKQMIRLDINYALKCSFWLDVKILLLTFPAVYNEIREGLVRRKQRAQEAAEQPAKAKGIEVDRVQQA